MQTEKPAPLLPTDPALQLKLAQQELAGILYAVSHDVRAPLRSIAGFSQALQEHTGVALDDIAQRYLQRIQQASQKLSQMIEGLLSLSRITQAQLHAQTLNLTELCGQIETVVRTRYPQQPVELVLEEAMEVQGDPQLLKIAIDHLLDNAWKATANTAEPKIIVSCTPTSGGKRVTIRDNGVGFDMLYSDKLFVPFQKLHTDDFAAGLGIGLAAAQRIAAQHGGRICAEAQPQSGAAFHLELPAGA